MIPKTSREWIDQVKLGIRFRDAYDRKARWQRNHDWFMGLYDKGTIAVNIVFGIGRGLIPQIYFKSPTVVVRPRPADIQSFAARMQNAKILEAADSYLIQEMQLKKTLKLVTLDAFLYNIGVIKVGYHSLETEIQPTDDGTDELMAAIAEMSGVPPEQNTSMRDWYSYHDLVKPDMPWALRWSPRDFVVPPGCRSIEEAPWCGFRFVRRLSEIMASSVYPMRFKRNLQPNSILRVDGENFESPKETNQSGVGQDDEYVEGYEIWDKRTGKIIVAVDGHDKLLRDEEHGLELDCLPVTIVQFNPMGDDFWGISHCDAIAPQVEEFNETRTHEMAHRKRCSLQLLLDKQLLPKEEIAKIERGEVNAIVLTDGPPGTGYAWLQPNMSRDIYKVAEDIFQDIKTIIGYNRNQGGEFESSRRTATEVSRVAQQNMIRDDELRDIVGDAIADLFARKIHPLIFQNWTTERVFEVTALGGWVPIVIARIRGNYDVTVVPDSTLPMSKEMAKMEALELFKMFNGDPMVNQLPLRRHVLERFDGIKLEELLKTPQQIMQEQQQMQQQQMTSMVLQGLLRGGGQQGERQPLKALPGGKNAASA